jgi:hypothetical protein
MKQVLALVFAALIAATAPAFAAVDPAFAQERECLSDRQIYAGVEEGEIAPLDDVLRANGIDRSTEILSVRVCGDGGGYSYYVGVLNSYGEAQTLVLPASL